MRWPLWQLGSSPGGEGVVVRRAAVFLAASSVSVARSPRVGVPSIPRVVLGGWWVCAGVIRTASDACFGGACWGVRPRESCGVRWGWGGAGPPVVVCASWVWVVAFAVVPFSSAPWSPLLPLPGSWVVSCQQQRQPDGSINPVFRSYLVENNEGQLLSPSELPSQRKRKK